MVTVGLLIVFGVLLIPWGLVYCAGLWLGGLPPMLGFLGSFCWVGFLVL